MAMLGATLLFPFVLAGVALGVGAIGFDECGEMLDYASKQANPQYGPFGTPGEILFKHVALPIISWAALLTAVYFVLMAMLFVAWFATKPEAKP